MRMTFAIFGSLIVWATASAVQAQAPAAQPTSPIVLVVGCAERGATPHVWRLSNVGERVVTPQPSISEEEQAAASGRPMGGEMYELVGVADFVAPDLSLQIGDRGDILTNERANTTGALVQGHKVAVKGLYISGTPARINVTSVVQLAPTCP